MSPEKRPILITLGDPEGIGQEVTEKALKLVNIKSPLVIIGTREMSGSLSYPVIEDVEKVQGKNIFFLEVDPGRNDPSFAFVEKAVSLALEGKAAGIVTAPVSKRKWIDAGNDFMGHTDYLVERTKTDKWSMFFWSDTMKVALYTTHIPLKDIFKEINEEKIKNFCRFIDFELLRLTGKKFNLLMSGLNPHAGEEGTLGKEEEEEISPAVEELKDEMNIEGPFPPDTVFLEAEKRKDPVVISLYHDQGLIPFKLNNINSGVNLTLGLPFIRTSPDHGTAYDIAGKGISDPGSMTEAIKLADQLTKIRA